MTLRNLISILLVMLPFLSRGQETNNDSGKVIKQEVNFEVTEDDIEPPPPHLVSSFKTLQEWLLNICEKDKPKKAISKYKFELFESPNNYTVALVGVNTYDEEKNHTITRIEFEPTNMYFKLPRVYYENLNREQVLNKLTSELKDFSNTEKFKTCFLASANIIVFNTNRQIIWSKK